MPRRQRHKAKHIAWEAIKQDFDNNFLNRQTPTKGTSRATAPNSVLGAESTNPIREDESEDEDDRSDLDTDAGYENSAPHTPTRQTSGRFTIDEALRQVYVLMKAGLPTNEGSPKGYQLKDGTMHDQRRVLIERQMTTRMFAQYFAYRKMTDPDKIVKFTRENPDQIPIRCWAEWRMSDNFFDLTRAKQGQSLEFTTVVFDECHALRNTDSSYHYLARLLPASHFLGMTGTSLFNRTSDCFGYMKIFAGFSPLDKWFTYAHNVPRIIDMIHSSEDVFEKGFVTMPVSEVLFPAILFILIISFLLRLLRNWILKRAPVETPFWNTYIGGAMVIVNAGSGGLSSQTFASLLIGKRLQLPSQRPISFLKALWRYESSTHLSDYLLVTSPSHPRILSQ